MAYSAIPTLYKGVQMRSRLEAKFAVLFDHLKWEWGYEELDFQGRIPDFTMRFAHPTIIECKPASTIEEVDAHRRSLIVAAADWLCADVERELRELEESPVDDLARIDVLINCTMTVRDLHRHMCAPGRRALVAGSQLFIEQRRDCAHGDSVTLDGEHVFVHGGDHTGLMNSAEYCLVCGDERARDNHRLIPSSTVLGWWRTAGNHVQWRPPA